MAFKQNESGLDRIVRLIAGVSLIGAAYLYLSGWQAIVVYVLGAIALFTAATGFCAIYKLFGFRTRNKAMKKIIYIILAALLGFLLSFIIHAGLEVAYIVYASKQGIVLKPYLNGNCFLPPWLSLGLAIAGVAGGAALGFWWWDIVYIKKLRRRKQLMPK